MNLIHHAITHTGHRRENNEDAYLVVPGQVYAVADGMGGHAAGEVASQIAITTCKIHPIHTDFLMDRMFTAAHRSILEEAGRHPEYRGMGTTLTALAFSPYTENPVIVGHVGDSRLYLLRGETCRQITNDHTIYGSSALDNCLGVSPSAFGGAEITEFDVHSGDTIILCTDGLANYANAVKVYTLTRGLTTPQRIATKLVNHALDSGGMDNVTVIALKVV